MMPESAPPPKRRVGAADQAVRVELLLEIKALRPVLLDEVDPSHGFSNRS